MSEPVDPAIKKLIETFVRFNKAEWRKPPGWPMKPSEIRVLLCIQEIAREGGQAVTVTEISKRLAVTCPTVTQMTNSLCSNQCIVRSVDAKDRRTAYIQLSDKGELIVRQAVRQYKDMFFGLIDTLGKEQSEALISLLEQAYAHLDEVNGRQPES